MNPKHRVCMFVQNGFSHDTRVLKQAMTLTVEGYDVCVIASHEPGTKTSERVNGIRVARVPRHIGPLGYILRRIGAMPPFSAGDWTTSSATAAVEPPPTFAIASVPRPGLRCGLQRAALRAYRCLIHARFQRNALRFAKTKRAEVWVAHDLDTLQVAERARRRLGGGLVYDSHELFLERAMDPPLTAVGRRRWRRIEQRLIRRVDRVTTVCPAIAEELAQRYGIPRPAVVMNAPFYEQPPREHSSLLRALTGLPPTTRIALYAGGIQYSRPLHLLVEAARHLDDDWAMVIVGPSVGTAATSLQALVADHGLENRVMILPPVPQQDVVALAAGADVGLVPLAPSCLNHVYALPNKLFQYIMAGLPVAASPMVEVSRIIERYDVGAVFPENEPKAIADMVMALFTDTRGRERMRDNALRAARELSWERQVPRVLAAVGEAHAMRRRPRRLLSPFRRLVETGAG